MFKSLQDFFQKKRQDPLVNNEEQLKLATAVLLFEVIRADGRITKEEVLHMAEILRQQFDLAKHDIKILIRLARKTSHDAISLQGFTRQLCEHLSNDKRLKLLENLWIVALADEKIDSHERHIVRKVASLLYLTETQITVARENAKKLIGTTAPQR